MLQGNTIYDVLVVLIIAAAVVLCYYFKYRRHGK